MNYLGIVLLEHQIYSDNMPRASIISSTESAQVIAYNKERHTYQKIADKIYRSKNVVWNVLQALNPIKTGRNRGTKCAITNRTGRKIQKWLGTGRISVPQVKAMFKLKNLRWNVWRATKKWQKMMWRKMKTASVVKKIHRKNLLNWAIDQVIFTPYEWRSVIFSDEKKV